MNPILRMRRRLRAGHVAGNFRTLMLPALLTACMGGAPRPPPPLDTAVGLERRACEMYAAGNYAGAARHFERAFGEYARLDLREPMLRNRIYASQSALLINDLSRAAAALESLEELVDQGAESHQRHRLRLLQSEYLIRSRHYAEAVTALEGIIAADDAAPAIRGAALVNRARTAFALSESDREHWLHRAQSLADGGLNQSRLRRLKASTLAATGDHAGAEKMLLGVLDDYRQALFQPGIAATLGELGHLMESRGAAAEAVFFFRRALALRLELKDIPSSIELTHRLQSLAARGGDAAAAKNHADRLKKLESLITSGDSQL